MKTLTTKTLSTDCLSQVIHVDPLLESVLKHEGKKKVLYLYRCNFLLR